MNCYHKIITNFRNNINGCYGILNPNERISVAEARELCESLMKNAMDTLLNSSLIDRLTEEEKNKILTDHLYQNGFIQHKN